MTKPEEILAVDEVLARLSKLDPRQARVVELRDFGGLSVEETAAAMGIATRTVKLDLSIFAGLSLGNQGHGSNSGAKPGRVPALVLSH